MAILFLLVGLAMLVGGAELLVRGGGALALALKVPAMIVALTVVAFGTSAPELAVSVSAALGEGGSTEAALANVTGSNIANILLVLGVAALIRPLVVDRGLIKREIPALLILQLLIPVLCMDAVIGRIEGMLLFAVGLVYNGLLIRQALKDRSDALAADLEGDLPDPEPEGIMARLPAFVPAWAVHATFLVFGLAILVAGAQLFVSGAFTLATWAGFSERFIGLTVIALGTSAPEIATGAISAWRGETEIALGNSVGSNILNISMVLALTSMIKPVAFEDSGTWIDLTVANGVTLLLVPIILLSGRIGRVTGGLMIAAYLGYILFSQS